MCYVIDEERCTPRGVSQSAQQAASAALAHPPASDPNGTAAISAATSALSVRAGWWRTQDSRGALVHAAVRLGLVVNGLILSVLVAKQARAVPCTCGERAPW